MTKLNKYLMSTILYKYVFFFNNKHYSNVFNIQFIHFDFLSVLNNEVKIFKICFYYNVILDSC